MATVSAPATASTHTTPASAAPSAVERLASLDAFRGLTMILLISHGFGIHPAFKDNPSLAWLAYQFEHAPWIGCTLWDLIQPAFTFIVGAAMPFAFASRLSRGDSRGRLFGHVAWRAFFLLALSNILSNWGSTNGLKLQFINVLCQIAFGYLLCFALWNLAPRAQAVAALALFVVHNGLFFLSPGPGGPFDPAANIGARLDLALLGYNYSGFYTTFNFLGNSLTILAGMWTGMYLRRRGSHTGRVKTLLGWAAACWVAGMALTPVIPMVKRLWLGSFLLVSLGWVLAAFAACYWLMEAKGKRGWAFPALVVGANSLFIYSFSQVLRGWLSRGLGAFTGNFTWLGPAGAIPQNLAVLAVMFALCYWLYRRKIFVKI